MPPDLVEHLAVAVGIAPAQVGVEDVQETADQVFQIADAILLVNHYGIAPILGLQPSGDHTHAASATWSGRP